MGPGDASYAEMKRIEDGLSAFARLPVLLGWGMRDPVLTPQLHRWWRDRFPRAVSREAEEASHFLQEDAPEQVVGWVEEFLESS